MTGDDITLTTGNMLTITTSSMQPTSLTISGAVQIDLRTGKVTYISDVTPDEAARLFWEAVENQFQKEPPMKALATIALLAFTTAAHAAGPCDSLPPIDKRQPPSVPVHVTIVPDNVIAAWCHKDATRMVGTLYGCTYQPEVTPDHKTAEILLNANLTPTELQCVLLYEYAHLAPNNWLDPYVEALATDAPNVIAVQSLTSVFDPRVPNPEMFTK